MKIELHVHSTGFSYCGKLDVEEIVALYSAKKYDAIVLTNHFNSISERFYNDLGGQDYHRAFHDMSSRMRPTALVAVSPP